MDNRPIGIFDSGLGGLTVLRAAMDLNPAENMVYFGDNGRAPYGTKSKEVIVKYTFQDINFLLSHDVKMLVIGCNTASACSLDKVRERFPLPIIDVVGPGAKAAAAQTRNGRIGVIGTAATVGSKVYEKAILQHNADLQVFSQACSLFVPLVEEGWWENEIAESVCRKYLEPLKAQGVDTLVLGCTHYPFLKNTIQKVMGPHVVLVNSAVEVAKVVKETLGALSLGNDGSTPATYDFYTSDSVEKFEALGSTFLNREIQNAKKADIEQYASDCR